MTTKENIKEYLTKEEIARIRVIIFLVGVLSFVFMETDLFDNLNDIIKLAIYASLFGTAILLKVDLTSSKEIGKQIMNIYKDKKLNWYEKGQKFGNIGMQLIHKAGELWELGMAEQFPEKEPLNDPTFTAKQTEKMTGQDTSSTDIIYTDTSTGYTKIEKIE